MYSYVPLRGSNKYKKKYKDHLVGQITRFLLHFAKTNCLLELFRWWHMGDYITGLIHNLCTTRAENPQKLQKVPVPSPVPLSGASTPPSHFTSSSKWRNVTADSVLSFYLPPEWHFSKQFILQIFWKQRSFGNHHHQKDQFCFDCCDVYCVALPAPRHYHRVFPTFYLIWTSQ